VTALAGVTYYSYYLSIQLAFLDSCTRSVAMMYSFLVEGGTWPSVDLGNFAGWASLSQVPRSTSLETIEKGKRRLVVSLDQATKLHVQIGTCNINDPYY
jgi:hypothetical protein